MADFLSLLPLRACGWFQVSGVIGSSSKLTPEQQRSLIDLVTRSVDGFNDFMSVRCAWHATVSSRATDDNPRALNIAFPDGW